MGPTLLQQANTSFELEFDSCSTLKCNCFDTIVFKAYWLFTDQFCSKIFS